jgi:hypothetical protein
VAGSRGARSRSRRRRFKAWFDAGDLAFIDVGLFLLARTGLDVQVVEALAIYQCYTQLFGLSCVNQHSFHVVPSVSGLPETAFGTHDFSWSVSGASRVVGPPRVERRSAPAGCPACRCRDDASCLLRCQRPRWLNRYPNQPAGLCTQSGGGINRQPWTPGGVCSGPYPLASRSGLVAGRGATRSRAVHLHPARIPDNSGAAAR